MLVACINAWRYMLHQHKFTNPAALAGQCPSWGSPSVQSPPHPLQPAQPHPLQEQPHRARAPWSRRSRPKVSASCSLQVLKVTWLRSAAQLTGGGRIVCPALGEFHSFSAGRVFAKSPNHSYICRPGRVLLWWQQQGDTLPSSVSTAGQSSHLAQAGPVEPHPLHQLCMWSHPDVAPGRVSPGSRKLRPAPQTLGGL